MENKTENVENELKEYLREMYLRQDEEFEKMREFIKSLIKRGHYTHISQLHYIERSLSDVRHNIISYFEPLFSPPKPENGKSSSYLHDNVD